MTDENKAERCSELDSSTQQCVMPRGHSGMHTTAAMQDAFAKRQVEAAMAGERVSQRPPQGGSGMLGPISSTPPLLDAKQAERLVVAFEEFGKAANETMHLMNRLFKLLETALQHELLGGGRR